MDERTKELSDRQAAQAAIEARLEESRKGFAEKEAVFKASSEALKQEFELLATKIFDQQGAKHQERLSNVLTPFREQIVDFRSSTFHKSHRGETFF